MSTDFTPSEGPPAPPENPFESWGQVFDDPTQLNPYELRQRNEWVQALQSDDAHESTLNRALLDWGYLNEGESIDDIQKALAAVRAQREDPFAAAAGQESEPEYGEPGQPLQLDPQTMREIWQRDMAEERERIKAELRNEYQSNQLASDLQRDMAAIASQHKLPPEDNAEVWQAVEYRLQKGDLRADQIKTLVADTYKAWDDRNLARFNRRLEAQQNTSSSTPTPPSPTGATPSTETPVTDLKSLAARTMERARQLDAD